MQSKLQLFTGKGAMQASPPHPTPLPPLRGSSMTGRTSVSEAWECDGEATALTQLAVDLNLPPVLLRDALSNGEAQACTWSEARIFCPENARFRPGAGLGLAIAQRIAEQHRGKIEVDSQLGQGSRFTVTFPGL